MKCVAANNLKVNIEPQHTSQFSVLVNMQALCSF